VYQKANFKVSNPKYIGKRSLIGSFDLEFQSGLKINGVMLFENTGRRWVNFPSKEFVGKDGDKKYLPFIEFTSREVRDRFQAEVFSLAEGALL
jgi:hypothetical protein